MTEKLNVHVAFSGGTADEVLKQVAAFASKAGSNPLEALETDALVQELRDRLAKNGQVVKIVPFDDKETSNEPERAPRQTRKPRAAAEVVKPSMTDPPATPSEPAKETPKVEAPKQEKAADEWGGAGGEPESKITKEDVIASLNAFSAVHGQVKAREVMTQAGGAARLADISEVKYPALVVALAVKQAA